MSGRGCWIPLFIIEDPKKVTKGSMKVFQADSGAGKVRKQAVG